MIPKDTIRKEQYYKEYEVTYALLDAQGKTVIDVGLDWDGSSILWFLEHGAKEVYGFESDPEILSNLSVILYPHTGKVTINGAWDTLWNRVLIADIFKMDAEGAEATLSVEYLAYFKQFAVALHPYWMPAEKFKELRDYMVSVGAQMVQDNGSEQMWVKTL